METHMQLTMSKTLANAVEDAGFLQDEILTPLSDQLLGRRAEKGTDPEDCLRSNLALGIMGLMEEFAQHKKIGTRTEMAFTQALAFLMDDPTLIPGFALDQAETAQDLKDYLTTPTRDPSSRAFTKESGLFHYMSAAILAVARSRIGDMPDPEKIFPEGSRLHNTQHALIFLTNLHGYLQLREKNVYKDALPGLSDKDIGKIRLILNIAEKRLPAIDPEERAKDFKALVDRIKYDPKTEVSTITVKLNRE
jgi:hypothetical protein